MADDDKITVQWWTVYHRVYADLRKNPVMSMLTDKALSAIAANAADSVMDETPRN